MQKALTQMNLQLANVISDISGLTGQAILRAITAGERDAGKLAELRDPRIKASPEEIVKSLQGNWRPELLFVLQQELEMYDTYQRRITECDQQLQKHLAQFTDNALPTRTKVQPTGKKAKLAKNAPRFDLRSEMQRIAGVDLTRIDGIDVMVAQTILSEVGFDMTRGKTEAHFASWPGLCPDNQISGAARRTAGGNLVHCLFLMKRSYPEHPIVGVGAVIVHDGRALLVRRNTEPLKGEWSVPGGVLEIGEKLRDGAAREALEETGLRIEVGPVLDVFDSIFPDADGRAEYHFVLIDFLCHVISGEAAAASDVSEVQWVTAADLGALNLRPTVAQVVRQALRYR